ncbi:hypothetical protein, partial [Hallella multisaccharivorax]|uniref:hypothetical protein n=1 Tax=Hallella multisaccharivorax TaxID=310514 RepID=UPI0036202DBF
HRPCLCRFFLQKVSRHIPYILMPVVAGINEKAVPVTTRSQDKRFTSRLRTATGAAPAVYTI